MKRLHVQVHTFLLHRLPSTLLETCCTYLDRTDTGRCRATCRSMSREKRLIPGSVTFGSRLISSDNKEDIDIRYRCRTVHSLTVRDLIYVRWTDTKAKRCLSSFTRLRRLYLKTPSCPLSFFSGTSGYAGLTTLHVHHISLKDILSLPPHLTDLSIQNCGVAKVKTAEKKGWIRLLELPLTRFECRNWATSFVRNREGDFFEHFSSTLVHLGWDHASTSDISRERIRRCHWPKLESLTVMGIYSSHKLLCIYNFGQCPHLSTFHWDCFTSADRGDISPPSPDMYLLPFSLTSLSLSGTVIEDEEWKYLLSLESSLSSLSHLRLHRCRWQTLSSLLSCRPPLLSLHLTDNSIYESNVCVLPLELLPRTLVELRLHLSPEPSPHTDGWFSSFLLHCPPGLRSLHVDGGTLDLTIEHLLELGGRCSLRELDLGVSCRIDVIRIPKTVATLNTICPDLVQFRLRCCICCRVNDDIQEEARSEIGEHMDTRIQLISTLAIGCRSRR